MPKLTFNEALERLNDQRAIERAASVPLYRELATRADAWHRCVEFGMYEWQDRHAAIFDFLVRDMLPSGSGWDRGTIADINDSTRTRLHFSGSWHHMDENGFYCGWSDHSIIIRPAFLDPFEVTVTGRDRNDIKEHLAEAFRYSLGQTIGSARVARILELSKQ